MNKRTRKTGANSILTLETSTKQRKSHKKNFQSLTEAAPYLQIQSVPIAERVDPERNSYILLIQPHGIRAAGGQYSASEAHEIAQSTRGWDWSLDKDGKPQCLPKLEALLNQICKRSAQGSELNRIEKAADSEQFTIQNTKVGGAS